MTIAENVAQIQSRMDAACGRAGRSRESVRLIAVSKTHPAEAIRDYYDYIRYTQSTQGHLNSQGLCFIDRQFPSPPGGS